MQIWQQLRMDYTPFTCTAIGGPAGLSGTDLEHIVAMAEAHDSGLPADQMAVFGTDVSNLTLAMPRENRNIKSDRDAADYLPEHNQCWFTGRVVAVKQKWGLSVDRREAQFLMTALAGCTAEEIARPSCETATSGDDDGGGTTTVDHPPVEQFTNCATMRAAGWTRGVNQNGGTYEDAWDAAEIETYGSTRPETETETATRASRAQVAEPIR